jgi:hypothetical protein
MHSKPKIMMIDMPPECTDLLLSAGWNVSQGTFGNPYYPETGTAQQRIFKLHDLPNNTEQEIIFIDLAEPKVKPVPVALKISPGTPFKIQNSPIIDPRPAAMLMHCHNFDRIFENGGILVIFAQARKMQKLSTHRGDSLDCDNWSFLTHLSDECLYVKSDQGYEARVIEDTGDIGAVLSRNLKQTAFNAKFEARWLPGLNYSPLVENKFGECIGFHLRRDNGGSIIVLPQIDNKLHLVQDLLAEVFPKLNPTLFPFLDSANWLHDPEYEHPEIVEIAQELVQLEIDMASKRLEYTAKVESIRCSNQSLHDLLTKHDSALVEAVQAALLEIGFQNVEIVDEKENGNNQEDLRFNYDGEIFVCEVKGLGRLPTEDDTHQVVKYMNRRIKQLDTTNVKGLVVVNHERHLAPLLRRNNLCFTEAQVKDAIFTDVTLINTWELFMLLRGKRKYLWPNSSLTDMFVEPGRFPRVPKHYEYIGVVNKIAPKLGVFGLILCCEKLLNTDVLAIKSEYEFLQFTVKSMQIDHEQVIEAFLGNNVGIKADLNIKEGDVIYRVGNC